MAYVEIEDLGIEYKNISRVKLCCPFVSYCLLLGR